MKLEGLGARASSASMARRLWCWSRLTRKVWLPISVL